MAFPNQLSGSKPQHPLSRPTFPDADSPPAVPYKDTYRSKALPSPPPPTPTMAYLPVPKTSVQDPVTAGGQARSIQNELFPAFDYCSDGGPSREDQIERIDEEVRKSSWVLNGDLNRADRCTDSPLEEEAKEGEAAEDSTAKEKKTRRKWFQVWRPKA